jgi:microcystin-dependent protein
MANPISTLDVSWSINASHNITINYISIAPPVGSIMAYTLSSSPSGWLICDGTAVSRSTYSALFLAIGITFGNGNTTTTFNVPNYQGAFLRGTGAVGNYAGPAVNTSQNHATQIHSHTANSSVTDPQHAHTQITYNDDYNSSNVDGQSNYSWSKPDAYASDQHKSTMYNINNASTGISVATTVANSTTSTDANETRPYNYGVYWIIKY